MDALLANYSARVEAARKFAMHRRVLLLKTTDGLSASIFCLASLPFKEEMIRRATVFSVGPGLEFRTVLGRST